jgi:hypothetical protein
MKAWFKWVLVLPAAVGAYAATQILLVIGSVFFPGSFGDIWTQFIGSILCPIAFVWAGAKTAPAHRFITGMVLTVLLTIAYTIAVVLTVSKHTHDTAWICWLITCDAVGLAGAIGACLGLRKEEDAIQKASIREVENALVGLEENARMLRGLSNN